MKFKLDIKPLSVNKAWQGRRFKSPEYKQYEEDVAKLLMIVKPTPAPEEKLQVTYRFYLKNHKNSDNDNPIKPLQDILVACGVIKDDRLIYRTIAEKIPSIYDYVTVEIVPMGV